MNWKKIKKYVIKNKSQSHLCICDTDLFESTIVNGIYGFPHSGTTRQKSFWRSIASMYNIGKNDLIFLYRRNGNDNGCREINGPFKIFEIDNHPATFYDLNSTDFPMVIKGEKDCKVRFLFAKFEDEVYSIANNYELIKRYEFREIWGYRHPAVMNIGAARKKSVAAFSNKQTLIFLDLMEEYGVLRHELEENVPSEERIEQYINMEQEQYQFKINGDFLAENYADDEAYLYSYFISALKNHHNYHSSLLREDFSSINDEMLRQYDTSFGKLESNILMEVIITTHLQDELDIVLTDIEDKNILLFEFKTGTLCQKDVDQMERYLDLLKAISPEKNIFANLVGYELEDNLIHNPRFANLIKLVTYDVSEDEPTVIRFNDVTIV